MTFPLVAGYAPYNKVSRNKPNKAAISIGMAMITVVPLTRKAKDSRIYMFPHEKLCWIYMREVHDQRSE